MDFELSKPQKLLQSSVRELLARECPTQRVRELMATETAFDEDLWQHLADQGLLGLTLPEEHEGLGLGAVDLAAVAEVMGSCCLPGPFLSNHWAATLLAASGHESLPEAYLEPIVDGTLRATVALLEASGDWDPASVTATAKAQPASGGYRLDGTKLFVSDAEIAGLILWVARLGDELAVFALNAGIANMEIEVMPAIDATRKLYRVTLADATVPADRLLAGGEQARSALTKATHEATIAACAELVGGMQWISETTVEYAKSRQQFGKPIGSFQAVQHRCADLLLRLESARSATYSAAWAVQEDDPEVDRLVSVTKAYCSDAAREVASSGIQVHGGIGFTWEHDLQLYFKRAKSNELLFGDATFHRERIARMIIDRQ